MNGYDMNGYDVISTETNITSFGKHKFLTDSLPRINMKFPELK